MYWKKREKRQVRWSYYSFVNHLFKGNPEHLNKSIPYNRDSKTKQQRRHYNGIMRTLHFVNRATSLSIPYNRNLKTKQQRRHYNGIMRALHFVNRATPLSFKAAVNLYTHTQTHIIYKIIRSYLKPKLISSITNGHKRKHQPNVTCQALGWDPPGQCKRGIPVMI